LVARPCIESGRKNSKKRKHILVQTTRNKWCSCWEFLPCLLNFLKNRAPELPTAGTFGQAASWCQTLGFFQLCNIQSCILWMKTPGKVVPTGTSKEYRFSTLATSSGIMPWMAHQTSRSAANTTRHTMHGHKLARVYPELHQLCSCGMWYQHNRPI
jgi:hypothetical protein